MADRQNQHPLRRWRISEGLTLEAAAGRVGTTRPVWHSWETGKRIPNTLYMPRIRETTGGKVTADDFFPSFGEAA
jgi:transcriptional regulator with XRE-family HTH domain